MNKTEAATEVVGEALLHGSGRIRLRRAVRGADPRAPYGGRALARLGRLPNPARAVRLRMATESALDFARKRIVWAAAALLLIAAAAGEHVSSGTGNDPLDRAEALLESREPLAALVGLDRLAVARADLRDPRASCAARRSAMRRLAVAGGSEAEALLARTAEARACGSVEARDVLRRRQTAKMAER